VEILAWLHAQLRLSHLLRQEVVMVALMALIHSAADLASAAWVVAPLAMHQATARPLAKITELNNA
jgi:hypothetical protein